MNLFVLELLISEESALAIETASFFKSGMAFLGYPTFKKDTVDSATLSIPKF